MPATRKIWSTGLAAHQPKGKKSASVNIAARIPRRYRRWWMSQAKAKGNSVSDLFVQLMLERFGHPPDDFQDVEQDWVDED
jgi:hypothetical protein